MSESDLVKHAAKRLDLASELLNQLFAIKEMERQGIVSRAEAREDVQRLLRSFYEELNAASAIVNDFVNGSAEHISEIRERSGSDGVVDR